MITFTIISKMSTIDFVWKIEELIYDKLHAASLNTKIVDSPITKIFRNLVFNCIIIIIRLNIKNL